MKYPYLYCGNITTKCPEKMPDGRCKLTERLDECERCPDSVVVTSPDMGFLIKYMYHIHNNGARVIPATFRREQSYPDNLFCGQIDKQCPYQSPGGKCKAHEYMPERGDCPHEVYLSEEAELTARLLQFIHRDLDKQK